MNNSLIILALETEIDRLRRRFEISNRRADLLSALSNKTDVPGANELLVDRLCGLSNRAHEFAELVESRLLALTAALRSIEEEQELRAKSRRPFTYRKAVIGGLS